MILQFLVFTANQEFRNFVGFEKNKLVPPDLLVPKRFGGRTVTVRSASYSPNGAPDAESIEAFVLARIVGAAGVVLLVDEEWLHLLGNLRASCLCLTLESQLGGKNLQNSVHKVSSRALKAWWQIHLKFLEAKDIKLLSLPLKNFVADELLDLSNVVRAVHPDLGTELDRGLVRLRSRLRPRRRSTHRTVYAVDDANRFFVYGHERHAKIETGGDHRSSCVINAHFRFGCSIDAERHFNVSETEADETTISGTFTNCHGVTGDVKKTTHLNIFASDMYC